MMRYILVDLARARENQKRDGGAQRVTLIEDRLPAQEREDDLIALDDALEALKALDERKVQVVGMRVFRRVDDRGNRCGLGRISRIP